MNELLVRVDDCLLHAQVLLTWGTKFAPRRVVLAHDGVAADAAQAARYRDLAEGDYEIVVQSVSAAAAALQSGAVVRTLVVLGSCADALRFVEAGAPVRRIQLGGLHTPGGKVLLDYIHLSAADAAALRALLARGVELEAQDLPASSSVSVDAGSLSRLWP